MNKAEGLPTSRIETMAKNSMPAIGIDLGGTKLSAAPVFDCKVVGEARTMPTPEGPDNIINAIVELIKSFQGEYVLGGIGIATAGIVNCDTAR